MQKDIKVVLALILNLLNRRNSFVKNQDTAALNQRINNDSNALITFYISLCQNIVINVITVFIGFAIIASFNMILAEVLFVLIPCYSLAYSIFKQKLFDRGLKLKQSQTDYFSRLNEQISFIKQIKVFGLFDSFSNRLNQVFTRTLSCAYGYQKVSYSFSAIDTLILSIAQVFLFIYGGHQVVAGKLSVGNFTIISSYFALMMTSVRYFFSLGKSVQETRVSYERLNGIMSMPVETVGKIELNKIETICTKSLSLSENNKTIVSDLNVSFETGHIYSICGFNGSGKSTFIISIKEEKIIIVVSHNDEVSQIADKTIWLEGGKQVREGK